MFCYEEHLVAAVVVAAVGCYCQNGVTFPFKKNKVTHEFPWFARTNLLTKTRYRTEMNREKVDYKKRTPYV